MAKSEAKGENDAPQSFGTFERLYIGQRVVEGKAYYAWRDVERGEDGEPFADTAIRYFTRNLTRNVKPGAIIRFTSAGDERYYSDKADWRVSPTFVQLWPDNAEVAGWRLVDRAVKDEIAARKEASKEQNTDVVRQAIAPIRAIYIGASAAQRRAIEIMVLEALRGRSI